MPQKAKWTRPLRLPARMYPTAAPHEIISVRERSKKLDAKTTTAGCCFISKNALIPDALLFGSVDSARYRTNDNTDEFCPVVCITRYLVPCFHVN